MKKAKIAAPDICDRLAQTYVNKLQGGTIVEIAVITRADFGERVKLPEISAERNVISSRWTSGVKVVHIMAQDWLYLRGLERALQPEVDAARQIAAPEPTARPASRAKTRSKPPASASK